MFIVIYIVLIVTFNNEDLLLTKFYNEFYFRYLLPEIISRSIEGEISQRLV